MKGQLKAPPKVVQLPGGIRLQGVPFKIIDYDAEGRPKTFEILPAGSDITKIDGGCALFADESWIRSRQR